MRHKRKLRAYNIMHDLLKKISRGNDCILETLEIQSPMLTTEEIQEATVYLRNIISCQYGAYTTLISEKEEEVNERK